VSTVTVVAEDKLRKTAV